MAKPRPFRWTIGDCYADAYNYAVKHEPGATLIHGEITNPKGERIGHAWLEVERDGLTYCIDGGTATENPGIGWPQARYRAMLNASPLARYTLYEASVLMVDRNHFGPWHDE